MLRLMLLLQAGTGGTTGRLDALVADAIGCRRGRADEIVVCARPDERSPYRLPVLPEDDGFQVDGPRESVSREHHRILDVGGAGAQAGACSAAGASGSTGCFVKSSKERAEQRGFRPF